MTVTPEAAAGEPAVEWAAAALKPCVICLEAQDSPVELQCTLGHVMCEGCVKECFLRAMQSESYYPPLCCRAPGGLMTLEQPLIQLFGAGFREAFNLKMEEYETMASFRTHCATPTCSVFLPRRTLDVKQKTFAFCVRCSAWTCPDCKRPVNPRNRHVCSGGRLDQETLSALKSNIKIKRCPNCRTLVEWRDACKHMVCICHHAFCFICLDKWPCSNNCPQYKHPAVDAEGFDNQGFNKDTGLNREGLDRQGYNEEGLDVKGYDREGFNFAGRDKLGFDREGFDEEHYDRAGFNQAGWNREGFGTTGYNAEGRNRHGLDREGRDKDGYDDRGYDKQRFDRDGFDRRGYNRQGLDVNGVQDPGPGCELEEGGHCEDGLWVPDSDRHDDADIRVFS